MGPDRRVILVVVLCGAMVVAGSPQKLPLALLGEKTMTAAPTMTEVPLLLVPSSDLALISNVHISAVSRSQPLVTCSLDKYSLDATPAVRVVLRRPVLVDSPQAALQFPSRLSILHEGLRMSVPIGALLAPVQGPGPYLVRVMYAVPTSPLTLHYPSFYAPYHYPHRLSYGYYGHQYAQVHHHSPVVHHYLSTHPVQQQHRPQTVQAPAQDQHTQGIFDNLLAGKKPEKGPLITVLQFPEEQATPTSLFYFPESEDELGNRNPPEGVVPAGIVQSTQPRPSIQHFINSKESAILQALREESVENAKKFKTSNPNSITVEAL